MEKTISQEERLRRAEEIYQRRKTANRGGVRVASSSVNNTKTKLSLFKKMALQLAICAVIYIIFYLIKNTNYIFSEDVINKTKELLSYDINFGNVYAQITSFIEDNKDKLVIPGLTNGQTNEEQSEVSQDIENTETNSEKNIDVTNEINNGGIGGAEINEIQDNQVNEKTQKSQMELDAEYIKEKCSFIVPVKGTVTSRYGTREKTEIVSAYHYGIDIGVNIGTAIYASMEGTVATVSSEGDYRKTYRNQKWRYYDKICSLQQNRSKTRSKSKTGTKNSRSRINRKFNRATSTF